MTDVPEQWTQCSPSLKRPWLYNTLYMENSCLPLFVVNTKNSSFIIQAILYLLSRNSATHSEIRRIFRHAQFFQTTKYSQRVGWANVLVNVWWYYYKINTDAVASSKICRLATIHARIALKWRWTYVFYSRLIE